MRSILAYGAAAARIVSELSGSDLIAGGLESAVSRAASIAQPGDVVLLSPACSSYDMFASYEERGRLFAKLAQEAA